MHQILKKKIEKFYELKQAGQLLPEKEKALPVLTDLLDLLEKGHVRVAERKQGVWQVNKWVKKGILLAFILGDNRIYQDTPVTWFIDKDTVPLRKVGLEEGVRVVPPAAGLRRGSYAGPGCVFMPPAYANIGAYIDANTMVEGLAGSCCQVGQHCHLSAGTVIGGVLDPIEAGPVIIGDYVLLGENSGVTQGTRLGNLVTLASGVHISRATAVLDPVNKVAYTNKGTAALIETKNGSLKFFSVGELIQEKDDSYGPQIPAGALIIPGVAISSTGTLKQAPLITKYIQKPEERAYALEEALRQ